MKSKEGRGSHMFTPQDYADRDAGQVRLTGEEREAIYLAGDHSPEMCDCSAYVMDPEFERDRCCDGLLDTFAAIERILSTRFAEVTGRADRAERELREQIAYGSEINEDWKREKARAEAAEAALAARQSDPDATERVEWGVRDPSGAVVDYYGAEGGARWWSGPGGAGTLVRRTVTTGEWTEVGE